MTWGQVCPSSTPAGPLPKALAVGHTEAYLLVALLMTLESDGDQVASKLAPTPITLSKDKETKH